MQATTNGTAQQLSAELSAPLRAQLDQELAALAELDSQREAIATRVRRLTRAIGALEDDPVDKHYQPRRRLNGSRDGELRPVTEATAQRVLEAFIAFGGDASPTQVANVTDGMSTETAMRAIPQLRAMNKLRLVGKTPKGGGRLYRVIEDDDS